MTVAVVRHFEIVCNDLAASGAPSDGVVRAEVYPISLGVGVRQESRVL